MPLLDVNNMTMRFGGLVAVDHLSFVVAHGEVVGLIGPNGAGKTTSIDCISGFHASVEGEIRLEEQNIAGMAPHHIAALGLSRTFQLTDLFGSCTVLESVMTGLHLSTRPRLWDAFSLAAGNRKEHNARREAIGILETLGLESERLDVCANISNYSRKRLGLAIALAVKPKLILIDELVSGLSAGETAAIIEHIRGIRDSGVTVLLVEHNMRVIMSLCDRIVVLNFGAKLAEGTPGEIVANEEVQRAYLGEHFDA